MKRKRFGSSMRGRRAEGSVKPEGTDEQLKRMRRVDGPSTWDGQTTHCHSSVSAPPATFAKNGGQARKAVSDVHS